MASSISAETEIKLTGVARACLEELLEDYRDYLRTHQQALWAKDHPQILEFRAITRREIEPINSTEAMPGAMGSKPS